MQFVWFFRYTSFFNIDTCQEVVLHVQETVVRQPSRVNLFIPLYPRSKLFLESHSLFLVSFVELFIIRDPLEPVVLPH